MNKSPLLEKIRHRLNRDYPFIAVRYEGDYELHISKTADDGFDIIVEVDLNENTLVFGPWHNHFDQSEEGEKELLWILSIALSRCGRLSVTYKGKEPIRCAFETLQNDGSWDWYAEMGSVNFNPFARKKVRYFQNNLIPIDDIRPNSSSKVQ
jgi:hypothetical protein